MSRNYFIRARFSENEISYTSKGKENLFMTLVASNFIFIAHDNYCSLQCFWYTSLLSRLAKITDPQSQTNLLDLRFNLNRYKNITTAFLITKFHSPDWLYGCSNITSPLNRMQNWIFIIQTKLTLPVISNTLYSYFRCTPSEFQ